jgi:ABC-type transport system involved in multi-copper enzyme maturation permease subunit
VDVTQGLGFWVAVALGGLGAAALLFAIGRAIVPTVLYEGPDALKNAQQAYVWWKVVLRLVIVAAVLAVALWPGRPLWFRVAAGLVALAFAGVFVYASFAKAGGPPSNYLVPHGLLMALVGALYLAVSLGVVSDSQFIALIRRELSAYFYSLIAYLILFGMAGLAAIGYLYFYFFQLRQVTPEPIVQLYTSFTLLAAFQCVFLVPALTMRLFSEEKRTGTLEVLLTAPVNESVVVLSKFISAWIFFMICWLPAGLYLLAMREATGVPFDYRPLFSYYLAMGACGAAFLAVGMFFSSLTTNQIVAAVLTFAVMMFLLLMVWSRPIIGAITFPDALQWLQQVLLGVFSRLDFYSLWNQALSGQLLVRDVLIQLSVAAFWLFLTVKVLEARKWG